MLSLTVLFCMIAGVFSASISPSNSLFNVNSCDDTSMDGRFITGINSILTQWRVEFKSEFCDRQCAEYMCECDDMTSRFKRNSYGSMGFDMRGVKDNSATSEEWISVNVCRQVRFEDVLNDMTSMLYKMKKQSFTKLCELQCAMDICYCNTPRPTTTTTMPPPPRATPAAYYAYAQTTTTRFVPPPVEFVPTTTVYYAPPTTTTRFVPPPVEFVPTTTVYYAPPTTTTRFVPPPVEFVPTTTVYYAPPTTTTRFVPPPVKVTPPMVAAY